MINFDMEKAHEQLLRNSKEAEELLKDADKTERFLQRIEKKIKGISGAEEKIPYVFVMISLVRSYMAEVYREIPKGSVVTVMSAFVYLLSPLDMIPDSIPVIGYSDDIAVLEAAWKIIEADGMKYKKWCEENNK